MSGSNARRSSRITRRLAPAAASLLCAGGIGLATVTAAVGPIPPAAAAPSLTLAWSEALPAPGGFAVESSPAVDDINGTPAAVFGDQGGRVYAVALSNGQVLPGWPAHSYDGGPVDSPPSVSGSDVYFGIGNWAHPSGGGYQAVNNNGATVWHQTVTLTPTGGGGNEGVMAGLTYGNYNGTNGVFAGSLGQEADTVNAANGAVMPGFPWFQADTVSSSAVLANLYGTGNEIVFGGAQTAGLAEGESYPNGGHVRVLSPTGKLLCNYFTKQPVYSSPALGRFLAGAGIGIAASTTYLYSGQGQVDDLLGFNTNCGLVWDRPLPGNATGSPAVVDALGNHALQLAETSYNTSQLSAAGDTTLVNGANGAVIWQTPSMGAALGGPVSVDLGGGYQDLVVAGTRGVQLLDGRNGQVLWSEEAGGGAPGMQNSALVTDDPNGTVGITLVGYSAALKTVIDHYEVSGSNGGLVTEAGSWPEFHHDPQLTGNAGTAPLPYTAACSAPRNPNGYVIASSGGEVYNYGNLPYCGSAINLPLSSPIVGVAVTPDGGGYYLVGSNGGLFAFGDAKFYGAASQYKPGSPVVGMAVAPNDSGYYEVTSAGGLFNFGSGAVFDGSGASYRLGSPVVGMAIHPGGGYWEAMRGGGLLSFGVRFHGAATGTKTPIVGVGAASDGSGYWEITSGGGVFSYGAPFEGAQTGTTISGLASAPASDGYWLVSPPGGVFAHGSAAPSGSRGGLGIEYPMVGIGGTD